MAALTCFGLMIVSSALLGALIPNTTIVQTATPQFGDHIVRLEGWDIVLSPSGDLAAGKWWGTRESQLEVRLWDLQNLDRNNENPMEPAAKVVLTHSIPAGLVTSVELSFSPDEQYLALRKDFDLTIFTVPDLQIYTQAIVSSGAGIEPGALSWSVDGRFLATLGSGDLVVWDKQNNRIRRHELDGTWGPIISVDNGWLVLTFTYEERPLANAFAFCTSLAEACMTYRIERLLLPYLNGQSVVASPHGQYVMTYGQRADQGVGVWAWQRTSNGEYALIDKALPLDDDAMPLIFSGHGRYLATHGGAAIWDYEAATQLQPLNTAWDIISFGPDNEHFAVVEFPISDLRMYRVGQSAPIDSFTLLEHLDPAAFDPGFSAMKLTVIPNWVLANIRQSAVLIPLVYE